MSDIDTVRVLFVCMCNICRSPTAEGVFRARVEEAGLAGLIEVDSAGTHAYHVGAAPDSRSQATARRRGIDLSGLRGRQIDARDFERFDYLLGMDRDNLANMLALQPPNPRGQAELMLRYASRFSAREVPDPYFGNDGFELVFDMIDDASRGLLEHIRARHSL